MKAVCRPSGILFEVVTEEGGLLAVASTVRTAVANALDVWRRKHPDDSLTIVEGKRASGPYHPVPVEFRR